MCWNSIWHLMHKWRSQACKFLEIRILNTMKTIVCTATLRSTLVAILTPHALRADEAAAASANYSFAFNACKSAAARPVFA